VYESSVIEPGRSAVTVAPAKFGYPIPEHSTQGGRTLRDLARLLASATYYNGKAVYSLTEIFGVSVEAMAIRLEELDLVR
jgi:hypothetical protein